LKRMVQIALISLFCLTLVSPAMATNGTGSSHSGQTGTMTGTSNGCDNGNDLSSGTNARMNGTNNHTNGIGTLDLNDDNNRTGVRARNIGGNVRANATTDNGTDWGWLGLLGLLGLAGMFNKGKDRDRTKI
jgi:MYXO-CTERM domain-containing protein